MAIREVIFRGKMMDADGWVYGTFLKDGEPFKISLNHPFSNCYIVPETDLDNIESKTSGGAHFLRTRAFHVFPETVGQYTGLTDKNGKKIFEGDVIKSTETGETALVQWFTEHASFMVWCKALSEVVFLYEVTEVAEVIGNIHDNPELIGGEPE